MKFNVEKAKAAGYTDQEIESFLAKNQPKKFNVEKAKESGYSDQEIEDFLAKESSPRKFGDKGTIIGGKVGRAIEAGYENPSLLATELPTAALQSAEGIAKLSDPIAAIASFLSGKETPQASKIYTDFARKDLPEEFKQGAQDIADIESILLPIPGLKGASGASKAKPSVTKNIPSIVKANPASAPLRSEKYVADTFESGLTKPGAVESKNTRFGIITKERQKEAIRKLENEAKDLIKGKVSEHVPLAKNIQEGFDFNKYHQEEFGKLKSFAEKANPEIDIDPLSKFFSEARSKYRGIPNPHSDAKSVIKEIDVFRKRVPGDLKDLLKIRRSNGQKLNQIYEQRLLKGKRHEYADFLNNMNKKIDESIEKTLPEDSAWFKRYKELNTEFRDFKRAEETLNILEPLLREKMSSSALVRLAEDPKKQRYLKIKMTEEGADEIIQIAQDLKKARDAIKSIPVKELSKYDAIWPISWIFKPFGIFKTVQKGYEYGRRGFGYLLSSPGKRKVFDDMLQAVSENSLSKYEKAAEKLSKD